jgi:sorting nexin-4
MLSHTHALLAYTHSHRSVLRLRDQKQLDFEELTDYLSSVVTERDRLASLSSPHGAGHGHGGVRGAGISGYLRDRVDSLRGVDEERTRVQRMQRLDGRIQEVSAAAARP